MPEVIGIDHVYLTVRDLGLAERFYDRLLGAVLGFRKNAFVLGGDAHVQYFNRQFGIVLRPARGGTSHDAYAPGLHHLCLRVDSAADVAEAAARLHEQGIEASEARVYPEYAPDYVATFLVDPDGIRLEITNFRAERRERMEHWEDL
jgi:catechol 2,3-dioxygenase-like lactoylglutathione lyase family enzyme